MKNNKNFIDKIADRLFSSTHQLQRITILTGVLLVLVVGSFAGYYYYDRYYRTQPDSNELAVTNAEAAVKKDPTNPAARLNLAEVYMVRTRFDDALTQLNQVMVAEPKNQRAWFLSGVTYALKGDPANAIDPLQRFIDANKDDEMAGLNRPLQAAAYYLGDSYLKLNQPEKAVPVLEMNMAWAKSDADTMYKMGVAYAGVKEYDKALHVLYQASQYIPDFKEAYQEMALIFKETNQPALEAYANGMVYYSDKDYEKSKDLLLKSVQGEPNSVPTYTGLGMVFEALKDYPNAKTYYEAAVQMDPKDVSASNGLDRVTILLKK